MYTGGGEGSTSLTPSKDFDNFKGEGSTSLTPSKDFDKFNHNNAIYIIKGNVPAEKQSTTFFWEDIFYR
jgi:hypothetical protein